MDEVVVTAYEQDDESAPEITGVSVMLPFSKWHDVVRSLEVTHPLLAKEILSKLDKAVECLRP